MGTREGVFALEKSKTRLKETIGSLLTTGLENRHINGRNPADICIQHFGHFRTFQRMIS